MGFLGFFFFILFKEHVVKAPFMTGDVFCDERESLQRL